MRRFVWFLLILGSLVFAPPAQPAAAAAERVFVLINKLALRQTAQPQAISVKELAYGAPVKVLAPGPAGTVKGISGRWLKVGTGAEEGFVFDQFVSPLPAPSLTDRNFTTGLTKIGPPKEKKTKSLITLSQKYSHGLTVIDRRIKMGDGGYFQEQIIQVVGISVFQGFLLARAIAADQGPTDQNLTRWPELGERDGRPYINDDSAWQIIAVQGGEGLVTIMFPQRAD